ncbi:MAG: hypothetical protein LW629_11300 [Burkholderiales bacterium]|jgi:hypothetical protein|nr:hypothetical protein [Burkholderiales bacterium]
MQPVINFSGVLDEYAEFVINIQIKEGILLLKVVVDASNKVLYVSELRLSKPNTANALRLKPSASLVKRLKEALGQSEFLIQAASVLNESCHGLGGTFAKLATFKPQSLKRSLEIGVEELV